MGFSVFPGGSQRSVSPCFSLFLRSRTGLETGLNPPRGSERVSRLLKGGVLFGTGFRTFTTGRDPEQSLKPLWDTFSSQNCLFLRTVFSSELTREKVRNTLKSD